MTIKALVLVLLIIALVLTFYQPILSLIPWLLLVIIGLKHNKQLTILILTRVADSALVLFIVLIVTVALFGGTIAQIKKAMIYENVKRTIMSNPQMVEKLGPKINEVIKKLAEQYIKAQGLDKPWYANLPNYLMSVITLDLRSQVLTSNSGSRLVRDIIMERLPNTVLLFTTATIITAIIGIALGLLASRKRGSFVDKLVTFAALVSASFPMWWIGMLSIELFSYQLKLFPSGGMLSVPPPKNPIALVLDFLRHLALPLITIVSVSFGGWAYVTRSILIGATKEDYVLAAKARGLAERVILIRHILRPSLPPILTMVALSIIASLSGAIITEIVFNWPGMGLLYWQAIETLDVPVILGLTYMFTLIFVITMLILDILYIVLEPRLRR